MINSFDRFYKGKNVLITGHTGFKGSWLAIWLHELGANVIGYALKPKTKRDNYVLSRIEEKITHIEADIRSVDKLKEVFTKYKPEIVFHLAAQPIVSSSYLDPEYTYDVNVMGTLNVLERIKETNETKVGIMVTSDKCYKNKEWVYGYRENDEIGGSDPYSSSKGCAELLISAYRSSFLNIRDYDKHHKIIASVRAGNVIGGGDWSVDRIIPDCICALEENREIIVRNPEAIRPWQHVLEPLYGYLLLASKYTENNVSLYSDAWNFGPDFNNIISVRELAQRVIQNWGDGKYILNQNQDNKIYETTTLNLDSTKSKHYLKWEPIWNIDTTIEKTIEWYKGYKTTDVYQLCIKQIENYYLQIN